MGHIKKISVRKAMGTDEIMPGSYERIHFTDVQGILTIYRSDIGGDDTWLPVRIYAPGCWSEIDIEY